MKKEHLLFLVFVLAAAIVTGTTISLVNNFQYVEKQAKENIHQSQTEPAPPQASVPNASKPSDSIKNNESSSTNNKINNAAAAQHTNPAVEQGYLVLSKEEKQQINAMLVRLGATENDDYNAFIRNFQKEKSLNPTGSLDSLTLNAIINEVTRQRAAQMAGG